jgi:hypothetical protein
MKLYHHPGRRFALISLIFGIGIIPLVLAGVATAVVGEFLPWMALLSAAILGIPLGSYLIGSATPVSACVNSQTSAERRLN